MQKSYCTCKRPYKEGELMIKCDYDQCEGWYHLECVGFKDKTEEEIMKIKWYCSDSCKEVKKFNIIVYWVRINVSFKKANRVAPLNYKPIKKKTKGK